VGGYLAASGSATLLEPTFGWRIMWFLNIPTGLLLLLLNRYIPESPRFLLVQDRVEEADQILQHFGAVAVREGTVAPAARETRAATLTGITPLFRWPYLAQTLAVTLYGLAWGLVTYGFFLWLPSNLRHAGFGVKASDAILAQSALVAFPAVLLVAWLYSRWSSKKSMVLFSLLTALALLAFVPLAQGQGAQQHPLLLTVLVVALLIASSGMTSTLSPYSAEVYPTKVRATGAGLAAGAGKLGGLVGIGAVLAHVTPTLAVSALLVVAPVVLAMLVLGAKGIETRGRRLEETSALVPEPAA
jgi:putative MFS transporter